MALEITFLVALDFGGLAASFFLALLVRIKILPALSPLFPPGVPAKLINNFWWLTGIVLGILAYEGLYTARPKSITLAFLVVFAVVSLAKISDEVSRTVFVVIYVFCLVILPVCRYTGKIVLARLDLWRRKVLILGAEKMGKLVAWAFSCDPYLGYEVLGFLEDDPRKKHKTFIVKGNTSIKVLGGFNDAREVMQRVRCAIWWWRRPGCRPSEPLAAGSCIGAGDPRPFWHAGEHGGGGLFLLRAGAGLPGPQQSGKLGKFALQASL